MWGVLKTALQAHTAITTITTATTATTAAATTTTTTTTTLLRYSCWYVLPPSLRPLP